MDTELLMNAFAPIQLMNAFAPIPIVTEIFKTAFLTVCN